MLRKHDHHLAIITYISISLKSASNYLNADSRVKDLESLLAKLMNYKW